MTKFDEKAQRCEALGKAYSSVLERRDWMSEYENDEPKRPDDEYLAVQWDTLTEVMKAIEKML